MSNADIRGRFIWHELMTTDPQAAGAFYSKVLPWRTQPSGMPSYTLWIAGKTQTGGLMALAPDSAPGTPPHWLVYIGTPSVDATLMEAQRLGGKVLKGATDIPNVGRYAVLSDPQGATFALYTPASPPASPPAGGAGSGASGEFSWHELTTTDPQAGLRFYSELFGWTRGPGHDMGGTMGLYQIFTQGGAQVGGIYRVQDASTPPHWLGYVRVPDAARTAAAAKAAGGRVLHGPVEVPGGSWIAMLLDPQGGAFAVVEPPRVAAAKGPAVESKPKPAAEPATPAAQPSASAMPTAASKPAAIKPAPTAIKPAARTAPKPAAAKRRPARGKTAARSASKKKRPAGKRAAASRSTSAKRGKSAGKKRPAAKRAGTKKKARGKK